MFHNAPRTQTVSSLPSSDPSSLGRRRTLRGRRNHFSGIAAEETVVGIYRRRGATLLGKRVRTPEGELDLVLKSGDTLVFVEVKKRRSKHTPDAPIGAKQWRRLENAALHYMMATVNETGVQPFCRFDVALMASDGSVEIIENARSFDAQ